MASVNLQTAGDDKGSGSTLSLNHVRNSQFLANPEANVAFEAGNSCNGISISGKLKVVLHNYSLWLKFSRQQMEMILNKPGRRMFPYLVYKIRGMNPVAHYRVFLEIVPVDEYRWRFDKGKWSQFQKTENDIPGNQLYIHPDSPNTGAYWMKKEITFQKLKMTNNKEATKNGNKVILLQSLHKYQPRLSIEEVRDGECEIPVPSSFTHSFTFPETEFIAVTAYQNTKLSQLKIMYNPFARGIREKMRRSLEVDSTAMTTASPETDPGGSLLEVGEDSHQPKERVPVNPRILPQAAQPFQGNTYDATPSSSNLLSLGMSDMEHDFLPFTSPPTTHHNPRQDAMVSQGDWHHYCSSNSAKNSGGSLHSVSPVPMDTVPRTDEEKQPEVLRTLRSDSNDSGLGEEGLKKKGLSPDDSKHEMCPAWNCRQHARCLRSLKFCASNISTENASRGYTVGLGEGACQVTNNMCLTPRVLPQASKAPVNYACNSVNGSDNLQSLGRNGMNPGLPSICSLAMPLGPGQNFVDPASSLNSKLSTIPLSEVLEKSYYPEESVNKCLASVDSTATTIASPETDPGGSILEVGEGSHQAKERVPMNPELLLQAAQPFQGNTYDSTPSSSNLMSLGMSDMEHDFLSFTSPPTTHHNPREDAMVSQGDWHPSCSSNSIKNSGGWLQSVLPVPMDTVTRAEEEMKLEEELWTQTSDSNDSGLGEDVSKTTALSPHDSGDEMCSGWKCKKYSSL